MCLIICEWQLYPQGSQRATLIGLSAVTHFLQTNFIEAVFPDFAIIIRQNMRAFFNQDQKISGHDKTLRGANHASRVIHDKNV